MGTSDDRVLTVFNQIADFENRVQMTNPDLAERQAKGVEVVARKRFSNNWQALASVTWQKSTGTVGTAYTTSWSRSSLFNDPNTLINGNGPLDLDREWQVKLAGTYVLPAGFSISCNWQYLTGTPLYRYYSVTLNQGAQNVRADPKGSHRNDDLSRLDLRAEKVFSFGTRPIELGLIVDVFNVFNENAVILRNPNTGNYNVATGSYVPAPDGFDTPLAVQDPCTARLGVRVRF